MKRHVTTLAALISALFLCSISLMGQKLPDRAVCDGILIDAVGMMENGDPAGAAARFRYILDKFPGDDAANYYLGQCELRTGDYANAEKHLKKAIELSPGNNWYPEALASLYSYTGKEALAAGIYMDLMEKFPSRYTNPYTLTLLADRQFSQRQDSLALDNYDKALMYDPQYAPALLGRSEVCRMTGDYPGFFSSVSRFASDPMIAPSPKCEYVRAVLKMIDGSFYRVWGEKIDSLVMTCAATHPSDSSALSLAGSWFYGTGRKEQGKVYFDEYVRLFPEKPDARFVKVEMLIAAADWDAVLEECSAIVSLPEAKDRDRLQAYSLMGDCHYTLGNRKKAFKAYEAALKIDPDYIPVLNNYAYYLSLGKKSLAKAERMSRKTVEKEPDNPTYLDTLGWILYLRGRAAEARPYFKHAMLYGGKESRVILYHFSEVLNALGEKELSNYYKSLSEQKAK